MESSSSSLSLVSRAKTALHSAAAKAEKVLTDIKADLRSDRESDGQSRRGSKRSTDQEMVGECPERGSIGGEDAPDTNKRTIPPAYIIRQLALVVQSVKNYKSTKDLLTLVGDPLSDKDRTGISFSIVKSLVLREKEEKPISHFNDEEVHSLLHSLFSSEDHIAWQGNVYSSTTKSMNNLPKDIRGAPPDSFVFRLSEIMGGLKSLQKMASLWCSVIDELRRSWSEGQPIPHTPLDANPDLNACLLHQQIQAINCCITRKRRKKTAIESLDSVLQQAIDSEDSYDKLGKISPNHMMYARVDTGDYVLRLGADHPSEDLTMLETGEHIFSPITQEGPVLTEELIKETEEFVLRTGSVGAGCSQLLSDMQAFKAANPGCILEDFVRWHSPPDWSNVESDDELNDSADGEDSSYRRGRLSRRMQKEEAALPVDSNLLKVFYECKDYVAVAYQSGTWNEIITDICKAYETVETIVLHPEEAIMDQPEEMISEEPKRLFKKINLNFMSKDKQSSHKGASREDAKPNEKHSHVFSHLFDKKASFFSKMHPKSKAEKGSEEKHMAAATVEESDWTIV